MKKGILLIFIGVFLVSGMAMAKGPQENDLDLPENKWWQNPRVVKVLKLTEQEQSRLNDLFVNSQRQMFDLKTDVQKEKFEIEQLLEQKKVDDAACMARFKKLTAAQNALRTQRFQFLLEVRKLLGLERYQQLKTKFQQRRMRQRQQFGQGPGSMSKGPFPSGKRKGAGTPFPPGMKKGPQSPGAPPEGAAKVPGQ
jgi:Spy/CpxP family protein refolding chaperone